jgi:hypothetical protein
MKGISKTMLRTCAGLAVAAGLVAGGAGVANAATTSPTTSTTSSWHGFGCNPYQREQWNLNGSNTVDAVYLGNNFSYSVSFKQVGSCLSGTLTDSGYPTTGPIYGTINGNHVTFSFKYPSGSIQGTRTFTGTIHAKYYRQWYWQRGWHFRWVFRSGAVSGTWSETGSENGTGTFTLANNARNACPSWEWWARACYVY